MAKKNVEISDCEIEGLKSLFQQVDEALEDCVRSLNNDSSNSTPNGGESCGKGKEKLDLEEEEEDPSSDWVHVDDNTGEITNLFNFSGGGEGGGGGLGLPLAVGRRVRALFAATAALVSVLKNSAVTVKKGICVLKYMDEFRHSEIWRICMSEILEELINVEVARKLIIAASASASASSGDQLDESESETLKAASNQLQITDHKKRLVEGLFFFFIFDTDGVFVTEILHQREKALTLTSPAGGGESSGKACAGKELLDMESEWVHVDDDTAETTDDLSYGGGGGAPGLLLAEARRLVSQLRNNITSVVPVIRIIWFLMNINQHLLDADQRRTVFNEALEDHTNAEVARILEIMASSGDQRRTVFNEGLEDHITHIKAEVARMLKIMASSGDDQLDESADPANQLQTPD